MKAKIKEKKEIAVGTLEVVFDLLGEKPFFEAGQYFFINLLEPLYNDEKGKERHFSIVNSPNELGIIKMATRITDSAFKRSLVEMPIGSPVGIFGLAGSFLLPAKNNKLVMIAGGIGITPFISMLKFIDENNLNYDVVLIYANRNQDSAAYIDELRVLAGEKNWLKLIETYSNDSNWTGEKRLIDKELVADLVNDWPKRCFMVAGPPGMVEAVKNNLLDLGVLKKNIMAENFVGY